MSTFNEQKMNYPTDTKFQYVPWVSGNLDLDTYILNSIHEHTSSICASAVDPEWSMLYLKLSGLGKITFFQFRLLNL